MRKTTILTLTAFMALMPASAVAKNTTPKGGGHTPVTICHHAGPTKTITITVDDDAVAKHVSQHGDTIGPCPTPTPPPDPTPTPTPDPTPVPTPPATPTTPESPAVQPTPPVACEGGPPVTIRYTDGEVISTQPGCGETVYINVDRKPKPGQVVAPDRTKGHKPKAKPHAQVVAHVRAQQKALVHRVAVARAQQELPHTGFPAGLLALLGISTLAGGFALRRKVGLQK